MAAIKGVKNYYGSTSYTVDPNDLPNGYAAGDVLYMIVTGNPAAPSGWTQAHTVSGTWLAMSMYKKEAVSSESSFSLTATNVCLICMSGVSYADLEDTYQITSSDLTQSGTFTSPAATTSTNHALVLACASLRYSSGLELQNQLGDGFPLFHRTYTQIGATGSTLDVRSYSQDTAGSVPTKTYYVHGPSTNLEKWFAIVAFKDSSSGATHGHTIAGGATQPVELVGGACYAATTPTWSKLSTLHATIGAYTVDANTPTISAAAVTADIRYMTQASWSGISLSNVLYGVVNQLSAPWNVSGKMQYIDINTTNDAASTPVIHGVYYQDSYGAWTAISLQNKAEYTDEAGRFGFFFDPSALSSRAVASSGTMDWTTIAYVGIFATVSSARTNRLLSFANWCVYDPIVITGGVSGAALTPIDIGAMVKQGYWTGVQTWLPRDVGGRVVGSQKQYKFQYPVQIGDGTHHTVVDFAGWSLEAPYFVSNFYGVAAKTNLTFNLAANDDVRFSGGIYVTNLRNVHGPVSGCSTSATIRHVGSTWIGWQITWLDSIDCIGATFRNCLINAAGGHFTECIIENSDESTSAMHVTDGAEIVDCEFTKNGEDYAIDFTEAGTYSISGTTFSGYTKPLYVSASSGTVTITLAAGQSEPDYDTDGATVVFSTPATTWQLLWPNIIDDSRYQIYNVTQDSELVNDVVSGGSGIDETLTSGVDYDADDEIRYRITYQSGATAKELITGTLTAPSATTVQSAPTAQTDQSRYNAHAVDGSGITQISWDSGNIEIDIDDPDNYIDGKDIAAWYYYFITTATGIDEAAGAFVWSKLNEVVNCTSCVACTLDNRDASNPLIVGDTWIYRDDGVSIISPTSLGSIQIDPPAVFVAETGVSGLTPTESAKLLALDTTNLDAAVSTRASQATADADHDVTQAAISGLNNLSQAESQAAATAALNAYDPPTKAELDSAVSPLATQTSADADHDATQASIAALNNLSQADIRTAVGLASANLDTQIAGLPTAAEAATAVRAELATELARIDVATSDAVAAANEAADMALLS